MEYTNIGGVKIEKTAALAPMASVADRAYRIMAKEYGACYVVGEMASCKGLCYNDRKTAELLSVTPGERPMAVQLFGNEPEFVKGAVEIAERFQPDIIDINSGCPMPKIVSGGAGSALMKTPELFGNVVRAAVEAAHVPVTVKIRAGWDVNSINAVEIAKIAEQSGGISAVAIATPGMMLLDLSCRVCPTMPAIPPDKAIITSKKFGLVRARSCSVGSLIGDSRK